MAGNGHNTGKSRKCRKIRRLKRRAFRLFILVSTILFISVVFTFFGHMLKNKDDNGSTIETEKKKLSSTNDKINKEFNKTAEAETVSTEKLEEFKSRYNQINEKYKSFTVCVDAGHGGEDVGAEGDDGSYEKDQVLKLSYQVKSYLESVGVNVVMTRDGDKKVSLEERRNIAEECNADLLLSLHRNVYGGREEVNGLEAWINNSRPQDATRISENILKSIGRNVKGFKNRGVKWGSMDNANENYGVNKVSMASLILEVGFITSGHDNELFHKYLDEIAQGIAKGVLDSI